MVPCGLYTQCIDSKVRVSICMLFTVVNLSKVRSAIRDMTTIDTRSAVLQ